MRDELINIIRTLDQIEIKGKQNMGRLLGCIQHLEALLETINQQESSENSKEV